MHGGTSDGAALIFLSIIINYELLQPRVLTSICWGCSIALPGIVTVKSPPPIGDNVVF
jgi:hypothetical protein